MSAPSFWGVGGIVYSSNSGHLHGAKTNTSAGIRQGSCFVSCTTWIQQSHTIPTSMNIKGKGKGYTAISASEGS
jgi:hypothetical protein